MVACGSLTAISISTEKGVPKSNVPQARLIENWGMEGDAHAGQWHRQISLLSIESIRKMCARGANVQPGDFGENFTTRNIDLAALHVGDRIRLGECELEITQIGKECVSRCAIYARVGDCVMPREGLFARVVRGGTVQVGDVIRVETFVHSAFPSA
jgi:molybdopterin adenylyltransferase